jgi:phosphatidylglycerophosphate synthase
VECNVIRAQAANAVTVSRLLLTVAVLALIDHPILSFWLFVAAAASDFIDGALARWLDTASAFGARLDPQADALLAAAGIVSLLLVGWLPPLTLVGIAAVTLVIMYIKKSERMSGVREHALAPISLYFLALYELIFVSFASRAYGWHWYYLLVAVFGTLVLSWLYRGRVKDWFKNGVI